MKNINKIIVSAICALAFVVTGCKSIPSVDAMTNASKSIGIAAALVANQTKIDNNSRNIIIDIMNKVDASVPQTNETFEVAWTPIANAHVDELIAQNKINQAQGDIIKAAFTTAVKGLDYVMNVRFPKARQYQDLTEAATHGFCDGFLTYFKPANTVSSVAAGTYDKEAYEYMMKLSKQK